MRRMMFALAATALLLTSLSGYKGPTDKPARKQSAPPPSLKIGDEAPDFTLFAFDGKDLKKVSLSDYKGKKNVALAFYVFAFTGG